MTQGHLLYKLGRHRIVDVLCLVALLVSYYKIFISFSFLHEIKFLEQFLKLTTKGTFLLSLDEIGSAVYEEMSFYCKSLRTDRPRTKSNYNSSPCHIVAGELKSDMALLY